ncbi:MAG: putative transcriptional regulator [Candidatus Tokpelaia sp. JSC188]|nr:MAG: putative transcriptional regulator [Candidatus Tokpelaia sp. JSC188]
MIKSDGDFSFFFHFLHVFGGMFFAYKNQINQQINIKNSSVYAIHSAEQCTARVSGDTRKINRGDSGKILVQGKVNGAYTLPYLLVV